MNPIRFDAVAFDLDGLLIDSEPIFSEAARRFVEKRGIEFDATFMHSVMGTPAAQTLPMFQKHFGLSESIPEIAEEYKIHFMDVLGDGPAPLMSGVRPLITRLELAGIPFCIATSSGSDFVRRVFGPHGLLPSFRFVLTCEDVTQGKPHPEVYQLAASKFDVDPRRMLVLEDSPNGMRAAKAAGAVCCVVPHAATPRDLVAAADVLVPSLDSEKFQRWLEAQE